MCQEIEKIGDKRPKMENNFKKCLNNSEKIPEKNHFRDLSCEKRLEMA